MENRQHLRLRFSLQDSDEDDQLSPPPLTLLWFQGPPGSAGLQDVSSCNFQQENQQLSAASTQDMGQFFPTMLHLSNGVLPHVSYASVISAPPGSIRICSMCDDYTPSNSLLQLVWQAFPFGPSSNPPPGYAEPQI